MTEALEENYRRFAELKQKISSLPWEFSPALKGTAQKHNVYGKRHPDGTHYAPLAEFDSAANAEYVAASPEMFYLATEYRAENARLREALQECAESLNNILHYYGNETAEGIDEKLKQLKQLGIAPKGE